MLEIEEWEKLNIIPLLVVISLVGEKDGFHGGSDGEESAYNVGSLRWKDSLEEGMATLSSIFARNIPMDRGAWQSAVHGVVKSRTWPSN